MDESYTQPPACKKMRLSPKKEYMPIKLSLTARIVIGLEQGPVPLYKDIINLILYYENKVEPFTKGQQIKFKLERENFSTWGVIIGFEPDKRMKVFVPGGNSAREKILTIDMNTVDHIMT